LWFFYEQLGEQEEAHVLAERKRLFFFSSHGEQKS
jgi:hypothetical protein